MKYILFMALLFMAGRNIAQTGTPQDTRLAFQQNHRIAPAMPAPYYDNDYRRRANRSALGITGNVLGFMGGGCIGWPLGTAIGGGDPQWAIAGIGAGLIAIGLPLSIIATRRAKHMASVNSMHHDDAVQYAVNSRYAQLHVVANRQGIGLALDF